MQHRLISLFAVIALILVGCGGPPEEAETAEADVQIPPTGHPDTSGPEWEPLFSEDLSDAMVDSAGVWSWQDGRLTASADQAIFTSDEYDDYILDLEVMFEPHANSGIIVHASDTDDWIPNSLEIQIGDSHMPADSTQKTGIHDAGAMYGHVGPSQQVIKQPGEWNRYTVVAQGDSLWAVVNGTLVSEIDMSEYTSADVNPDGTEIPEWLSTPLAELPTEGHIGLQGMHGESAVYFRNIRIRPLD